MSKIVSHSLLFFVLSISFSCTQPRTKSFSPTDDQKSPLLEEFIDSYVSKLDSSSYYLHKMDSAQNLDYNQKMFLEARKWYKKAEPFILAFDHENYKTINGPNLLKVEAEAPTEIKKVKPRSFQVLEELLFSEDPLDKSLLQKQLIFLRSRVPFMAHNHILINQTDRHFLELIHQTVVNIATKGITGFDSPMLANSLEEAKFNYSTIEEIIDAYRIGFEDPILYHEWKEEIDQTFLDLSNAEFDTFDRYSFIRNHTNKQLSLIVKTAKDWGFEFTNRHSVNLYSTNLFDKDFFNIDRFKEAHSPDITSERVQLGKTLFYDKALSSEKKMSCGTCHKPELAFTDGHIKSIGKNGKQLLRNSPTLTYAAFQRSFFLDSRSSSLESQIIGVVNNVDEFHIDLEKLQLHVAADSSYVKLFKDYYNNEISSKTIRNAIATYVRSLSPFDSKFDRNMQGKENTLSKLELDGFNLFMGKAACATCHFPPAFNGTVPPKLLETEMENIGVPKFADFNHPNQKIDDDPGGFYPFEVEEKRSYFKTATVRNVAYTAPYMHNGVYNTLEEVIDFYNVGGGQGMGLDVPFQTLPPDSLNLTQDEKDALVAFMKTLSDPLEDY
ncbi:cytochrome-c peroxidase [Reichenbachiella versicolor]|uniref:cytochrome-c peroxidase n=1 Tax=Reichenbachiella versicolor TaxID=1821036 RepID=UPI000D6DD3A6|nr:cytochrome c peroxidase [Reichenbachiella versicolor]